MNDTTHNESSQSVSRGVLERIEREHIAPKARGLFVAQNVLFWTLWALALVLGAISVSILIFTELNVGWELYEMTHKNALTFFAETLPFMWLVLLIFVVWVGMYNIRHTRHGYRYSLPWTILLGLGGSVVGGLLLHTYNVSVLVDTAAEGVMPFHTPALHLRAKVWTMPEFGLHAGILEDINLEEGYMSLRTPDNILEKFSTNLLPSDLVAALKKDSHIRIIATSTRETGELTACYIMPWGMMHARTPNELGKRRNDFFESFEHGMGRMMHLPDDDDDAQNPCEELLQNQPLNAGLPR